MFDLARTARSITFAAVALAGLWATQSESAVIIYSEEVGSDVVFSYSGTLDLTGLTGSTSGPNGVFGAVGAHEPYFGNLSNATVRFYGSPYSGSSGSIYTGVNTGYNFDSINHTGDPFFFRHGNFAVSSTYAGEQISGGFTMQGSSFASLSLLAGGSLIKTLTNGDTITWNISAMPSAVPLPAALPLMLFAIGGLGVAARRRKTA